jgi:AraC-like DNA-binding protein
MVGFAGWYDTQPYRDILFYVPFQHLYLMGPIIFFYVQSLLNPSFRFGKKEMLHLIPGLLYLLFSIVMVVTDKFVLKKYYFLASGADPDFDTWYQLTGFVSMLTYFLLSLRYYSLYKKLMVQVISYADTVMFRWVKNFLLAFLLILITKLVAYIATTFFIPGTYVNAWWFFLAFAIIFYYIAITGYANSIETKIAFEPNLLSYRPALLLNYHPTHFSTDVETEEAEVIEINSSVPVSKNVTDDIKEWKEKLLHLLQTGKAYEDPELSLTQVAKQLKSNPSFISKMVNQGLGLNFNDFVNQFRIEAVKEMLNRGEHKKQTLLGIAFECGFNSKATFNRAFKKTTGVSPKEWMEKNKV